MICYNVNSYNFLYTMTDMTSPDWIKMSINEHVWHVIKEQDRMMKEALTKLETQAVNSAHNGRYNVKETLLFFGTEIGINKKIFILKMITCPKNHYFYQIWMEDVENEIREIVLSFHVRKMSVSYLTIKNIRFSECYVKIQNVLTKIQSPEIQDNKFLEIANVLLKFDPLSKLVLISTSHTLIISTMPKKRYRVV